MLRAHSAEVAEAADAEQAVERYQQARDAGKPYELVILDLTLVGSEGGVSILERLRALDPDTRVIVSSGYSDDAAMSRYAEHGFAGVLPKPYTRRELDEALGAALAAGG